MKNYDISSEFSEHHWPLLNTTNETLLDLGCGRHWTFELKDSSPVYLGQSAAKVIAIDASSKEIDYFNSTDLDKNKFTFICMKIEEKDDILKLINDYNPTVLKCDIEGFETNFYDITKEEMSNIKEIGMEYHSIDILNKISDKLIEWGFNIHTKARFAFVDAPQMGVLFCDRKN